MRIVIVTLVVLALAGCGAQQKSTDRAATGSPGGEVGNGVAGSDAVVASGPRMIEELTNQRQVFECPKCGMDFDAAGVCSMDSTVLVATRVDYTCPADGKAVEKAGHCPRCAMNARVEKTAMVTAPAPGGN
jgi:uncharacterized C2H2 Zn-finger protein